MLEIDSFVVDAFARVVCPVTFNVPVKMPFVPEKPVDERFVVDALVIVAFVEKRDASVAPDAERFVVEAFVIVPFVINPFVKERPVPEILVVDAFPSVV